MALDVNKKNLETIVEWAENFERDGKIESVQRAYYYDGEGTFYDSHDYNLTIAIPIEKFVKMNINDMRTHEARKIVKFAHKEHARLYGNNNN